ncbi:MAG: S46 family peptidase [Bacteroidales bacterium]|nr:S46 family peptidase [Bacteroidales bacterium]
MKKRIILIALALAAAFQSLRAEEGMWLPLLISQRIEDMQAHGFRLTAEDVYSVNQASLKDAVVLFGSGCTGELVSREGLLFTNHHCGFSQIQQHSSVEHDYLKDGFWAMSRSEELPNKGLTVSFLERMEDVTGLVLRGYDESMGEAQRDSLVKANGDALVKQAADPAKGVSARVEALYYANQYFLFVYKVYRDVRLVGAPPSSIGKFGGDTDNWMWPRHTGDFSIFRIYAGKDNEPADYSEDNIPYTPKRFFKISRAGVQEGDFTFVYGCPGSTKEYVTSDEVRYVGEVSDPEKIALRTLRLDIQKKYMSQDPAVRIQYASKNANVSNAWKKWQGESKGIARLGTVADKQAYERRFAAWAEGTRYEGLLDRLSALYAARNPVYRAYEYYTETVRTVELLQLANNVKTALDAGRPVAELATSFFKDYYQPIDEEIFVSVLDAFDRNMNPGYKPDWFKTKLAEYGGSFSAWRDDLFAKSLFTDPQRVAALTRDDLPAVTADPAWALWDAFYQWYRTELQPVITESDRQIRLAYRDYMRAQMEFEPDKAFYPDANLTLRVAYGHVAGYSPADAIYYAPVSTLKGIIEKDNPDIYDYDIPQVLRDLYAAGGREDQPVCFLATNHTSGGNSGSPVINADGNLIGINFDRVWEGTMSDVVFDPDYCRNISLDIRYLLFVVKEIGHADWLFEEIAFAD